jgi:hypothetical protein
LRSATSRAERMAFARQIIQRNCWWRLPEFSGNSLADLLGTYA